MTIKLSPVEVKNLVALALGLSGTTFDLEITARESPILTAFRLAIAEYPRCASDQKISAIKRFRELAPRSKDGWYSCIGLADAKWAVENTAHAIRNLEATGNLRLV